MRSQGFDVVDVVDVGDVVDVVVVVVDLGGELVDGVGEVKDAGGGELVDVGGGEVDVDVGGGLVEVGDELTCLGANVVGEIVVARVRVGTTVVAGGASLESGAGIDGAGIDGAGAGAGALVVGGEVT
jgi:hypothetical protein